ncbi:arginyltransferase [Blastopirellula marina]|uniref:Arginyl-tRNA-protein transferase-related protein n=1 Tax=Blastopirellula marina DSM 3645 TaxID=314230 RepID=A3ZL40_9BACT|nr:arginyltransferase [Blastopirellula marina]EAQ82473.1 arginyl-tRNA-protein transferase-related protein [Blastopirellula marina DSM 3645]
MDQILGFKVWDHEEKCPYLAGRRARLPLYYPLTVMSGADLDLALSQGARRAGVYLYRVSCRACRACEPIRLDVRQFEPRRRHRRVLAKGDAQLTTVIGTAVADEERAAIYNLHKEGRGLSDEEHSPISADQYREFLVETCCETVEFGYFRNDRLVASAIADVGENSLSAVYCSYDPAESDLSLGTYSVLKQWEFCRATDRRYLYLGFYIAESPHMNYKASFLPHQRRIAGEWMDFPES